MDTLKALHSEGIPGLDPSAGRSPNSGAGSAAEKPDPAAIEDEIDSITVNVKEDRVVSFSGRNETLVMIGKGRGLRWTLSGSEESPITVELEIEAGGALLRLRGHGGATVTLLRSGTILGEPRRLEGALFWSALSPGNYALRAKSVSGEKNFMMCIREL